MSLTCIAEAFAPSGFVLFSSCLSPIVWLVNSCALTGQPLKQLIWSGPCRIAVHLHAFTLGQALIALTQ